MSKETPVADWVTISDLYADPFEIYERLRAEGGVHWVPAVNRYLVTSYSAVHATELDQEVFSANEQGSLQIRAMGHSMLRRDDPEHYIERKAWQPALRPGVVKRVWQEMFEKNADHYLNELIEKGQGADLIWDFAAPYAAESLRQICGLYNVTQQDMQRWSQTMIDATGNYADDPEVWRLGEQSYHEVDAALDEMLVWHASNPDHSLISQLLQMPDYQMPLERIRANLKMTIGGGLNEPRDALGVATFALLRHPDQLTAVRADRSLWHAAFDETIRWVAPIGMYSRQTTRQVQLGDVTLPAGARLGICILSANRDESIWHDAASFNIAREQKPHLAFGKGVHVCLGAWVARSEVADVALPLLFERLQGLSLIEEQPAQMGGWVFRGMTKMPVAWQSVASRSVTHLLGDAEQAVPRVAIVGAGPSGCFTAQELHKVLPNAPIDVFDDLPTPFGLVRYGVAGDHQGTKAVAHQFERLFASDGVKFRGNTRVAGGSDRGKGEVSLEMLRDAYDVVVLATGMHADRRLNIPGAEIARGAGSVTRFLNGHPDEAQPAPLGEEVAIVGHGNVALDVARLLARDRAGLAGSDIDERSHAEFTSRVRRVHLIGRSEPATAKFDPVMVRELAGLPGVAHIVHGAGGLPDDGRDARVDAVRTLLQGAQVAGKAGKASEIGQGQTPRVTIEWWFGVEPVEIVGQLGDAAGQAAAASAIVLRDVAGETEATTVKVSDVITAVGFSSNDDALVGAGEHSSGRVEAGLYTAGWLRRGPRGTIPDQRSDAKGLASTVMHDLRAGLLRRNGSGLGVRPDEVDFDGWRRIDLLEKEMASAARERAKLRSREAMLEVAMDQARPLPPLPAAQVLRSERPVTVYFGSESGGAELVAEELGRALCDTSDVEVLDLGQIHPCEMDAGRLHLIVCSTYGDGEVPTSVQPFCEALAKPSRPLDQVQFAMFGMGDRSYDKTYSRGSELVDEALRLRGATRVGEYGRHDAGGPVSASESALEWLAGVLAVANTTKAPALRAASR